MYRRPKSSLKIGTFGDGQFHTIDLGRRYSGGRYGEGGELQLWVDLIRIRVKRPKYG